VPLGLLEPQGSLEPMERREIPDLLDQTDPLEVQGQMEHLELQVPQVPLEFKVLLVLTEDQEPTERPGRPDLQVFLDLLEMLDRLEALVPLVLMGYKVPQVHQVVLVGLALLVLREQQVRLEPLAPMVGLVYRVPQGPRVQLVSLVTQGRRVHLVRKGLRDHKELLERQDPMVLQVH